VIGAVRINAAEIRSNYAERRDAFMPAVKRGLRRIMVEVQRGADALLSGGGAAWGYPVPRRRGVLARGLYGVLGDDFAEVGDRAPHAWSIHTGRNPRWRSPPARPRPFLDDASNRVDHLDILQTEARGAW
jgi:hypothetical protein